MDPMPGFGRAKHRNYCLVARNMGIVYSGMFYELKMIETHTTIEIIFLVRLVYQ
jgi:hypothetical protein